ncbi:MAG: 6-phosphofructokinase, partial [Clostridiales bacterium]|nr:6-phosphofructokinase [Clostridiales bacterium]
MVGFERKVVDGKYACETKLYDLTIVANTEKKVPREWINESGNGILQGFIDYALPLIQGQTDLAIEDGLPRFVRLKKVRVEA